VWTLRVGARAARLVVQRLLVRAVRVAQGRDVHHGSLSKARGRLQAEVLAKAGGGGLPAESVSTS